MKKTFSLFLVLFAALTMNAQGITWVSEVDPPLEVECDGTATIYAKPTAGWKFGGWDTTGDLTAEVGPGSCTTVTDPAGDYFSYTISNIKANATWTALWTQLFTLTVKIYDQDTDVTDNNPVGEVTRDPDLATKQYFDKDEICVLTPTAYECYEFVGWYDADNNTCLQAAGAVTGDKYTVTFDNQDITVIAKFKKITYTIQVKSSDSNKGLVAGEK